MAEKTIALLDPTAEPTVTQVSMAPVPRVHSLNDKMLGFLWNKKPNGDILLRRIEERLSERFHFAGTGWHTKPAAENSADAATIEELARTSDLVINALGD